MVHHSDAIDAIDAIDTDTHSLTALAIDRAMENDLTIALTANVLTFISMLCASIQE